MDKKSVAIIGGGLAGLASAVFLSSRKDEFDISIYEASPKLGGRAYSFKDSKTGLYFDNGQHILAGWYKNTFDYLKIVGTFGKLSFQKSLEVNFIDIDGSVLKLKPPNLPAPFDILSGLYKFKKFSAKDKLALSMLSPGFLRSGKDMNALELLDKLGQTQNLITYFWEPFIYAVFNAKPENVSGELLMNILRIGFLKPGNSNLVIPNVNLNELFIDDAIKYFDTKGINYFTSAKISSVELDGDKMISAVKENGEKITADYFISAVPFFRFTEVFSNIEPFKKVSNLRSSSITSIHIFFSEDIPESMLADNSFGMTGLIGRTVQWIFKRNPRHLSLVISGSDFIDDGEGDSITDTESQRIYEIAYADLCSSIKNFNSIPVSGYKVIKEKRATFIPDNESIKYRLPQKTSYQNLFIAGDWTDTGYPATIESAITSAKKCADLILKAAT